MLWLEVYGVQDVGFGRHVACTITGSRAGLLVGFLPVPGGGRHMASKDTQEHVDWMVARFELADEIDSRTGRRIMMTIPKKLQQARKGRNNAEATLSVKRHLAGLRGQWRRI